MTHVLAVERGELDLMSRLEAGRTTMAVVRRGGVLADIPLLDVPMPLDAVATQPTDRVALSRQTWMSLVTSRPGAVPEMDVLHRADRTVTAVAP